MREILPTIASTIVIALGIAALVSPLKIAQLVNIEPDGLTGIAEIRATFSGFFLGLGASALYYNGHIIFIAVGTAWLSAALGRIISMICDRNMTTKNIVGILFEMAVGLLFVNNM
ncbi:MAG: DUF4345 family protein [Cyanobacteria bacterium J06635_13]